MNTRVVLLVLALVAVPASAAESIPIDASHTAVILSWNHRGLSHPVARLEKITGSVSLDKADLSKSSVSVSLSLDGLRTGDDYLDKRLKTAEFFDASTYPQITFKSSRVEPSGTDLLKITGDLFVHGITKSVVLTAKVNKIIAGAATKPEAGFDADVLLRRSDFDIGKYVPMVSDEVAVHITIEAHGD